MYLEISKNGLTDASKSQLNTLKSEANSGNPDAQYFLGKMYASGVGVPKSLEEAQTWLKKATFNGVPEAEHEAIAVDEELARAQEREAKRKSEVAEEARKQREAEDLARKEREARDREAIAKREADKVAARKDAERTKLDQDKDKDKLAVTEKDRLEKEKLERDKAEAAKAKSAAQTDDTKASFESDPCKGKSARFLSTCR